MKTPEKKITSWTIRCVEKSTGFLRSFGVIGDRADAEWHFRNTERTAQTSHDGWVPKFILPNAKDVVAPGQEPRI